MANFKNVLVIVPPNITFSQFRNPTKNTKSWMHSSGEELGVIITDVPLGAMTICSWVQENHQADVHLLDFNALAHKTWDHPASDSFGDWFDEELSKIPFVPDFIGFSSLFVTGYLNLLELGRICRDKYPESTIVVGGNVGTTMYKELFEDDDGVFDAACYGEGELPLQELFEADDLSTYLVESGSWITRNKSKEQGIFTHNFISDLDIIPPLDYDLIDIRDYQESPTIKAYTQIEDKTNYVTYMASRGCPFLCTFCSAHTVHGRKMRYFSVQRIEDELTELKHRFNPKTLVIEDDHFLNERERVFSILKIVRKLGMTIVFPNALALFALDREMLEKLAETGVRQLTLAVESGSPRVLKELMRKPLKREITERVANDCYELGIYTDCNIIIGMPGETQDDIEVAREFLRTLPANWFRINVATPLAGSDMYFDAMKNGHMVGDVREAGYKSCVIETEHFSPDEINRTAYEMNLEFNFVFNTDMERGNYERAAESFANVLTLKHDHAFALYYLGKCNIGLGKHELGGAQVKEAVEIMSMDKVWFHYAEKFAVKEFEASGNPIEISEGWNFSVQSSGIGRSQVAVK